MLSSKFTFFCCNCCMVPFGQFGSLPDQLCLAKMGTLIVGDKIDCYFIVVGCNFLFVLFDASFDDNIHVIFNLSFLIDFVALFDFKVLALVIDFIPFFYVIAWVHLLRITKNLLKKSIKSIFYRFLFPAGLFNSFGRFFIFSKD